MRQKEDRKRRKRYKTHKGQIENKLWSQQLCCVIQDLTVRNEALGRRGAPIHLSHCVCVFDHPYLCVCLRLGINGNKHREAPLLMIKSEKAQVRLAALLEPGLLVAVFRELFHFKTSMDFRRREWKQDKLQHHKSYSGC